MSVAVSGSQDVFVTRRGLRADIEAILLKAGLGASGARTMAENLADADARGVHSHGAMLVPMYVERLNAGSVSTALVAEVVHDRGATAVLDAHHMLGQLSAAQAMALAIEKARAFGIGMVTVRNAFHFGAAGAFVRMAAEAGLLGLATANTRPLMPAPGGVRAVVGNNPIAIGVPSAGGPIVVDMALSEVALGKIRHADAAGDPIPATWATDSSGHPTTDPSEAIRGMLLPTGGYKGFGLALMVDFLTGVISGGGYGDAVAGLYSDTSIVNNSAQTVVAIDPAHFGDAGDFGDRAQDLAAQVRSSHPPGLEGAVRLPGEGSDVRAAQSERIGVRLAAPTYRAIRDLAARLELALTAEYTIEGNVEHE